jgi:hypothetical protein
MPDNPAWIFVIGLVVMCNREQLRSREKTTGSQFIGILNGQKSALGSNEPEKLKVTVEWD